MPINDCHASSTERAVQQEPLPINDDNCTSSKSALELAASAAQLRQLMQTLLDSKLPKQHHGKAQMQQQKAGSVSGDQQHQANQGPAGAHISTPQLQTSEEESLLCLGSTSVTNPPKSTETFTADDANPSGQTKASLAGASAPEPKRPADAPGTAATAERHATASPGSVSLGVHARDLLKEIEAAANASPATTAMRVQSPALHRQQLPAGNVCYSLPQVGTSTAVQSAAVCAANSVGDSGTWSTALQQYQLHLQQQQDQQRWTSLLSEQQNQQQVQPAQQQLGENWADSCVANNPSPEGLGALSTPYSSALLAATAAPTAPAGIRLQLNPCDAAAAATASVAARIAAASSIAIGSPSSSVMHSTSMRPQQQATGTVAADGHCSPALRCQSAAVPPVVTGLQGNGSSKLNGRAFDGHAAAVGGPGGVLDPSIRLKVRSLRGPLEDAMRCFAELQEAREESSLLRATNARLSAAADEASAEKSYLLAERGLLVAQLHNMAVLLAADEAAALAAAGSGSSGVSAAAVSSQEATKAAVHEAEAQLETAWRLLPGSSSLRFMCSPTQLPRDLSAVAAEFQSAINRRQQQLLQLQHQLGQQTAALQQSQQANEVLQQRLAAAGRAAELTVGQVVSKLEAKWGKRVLKAEHKVTMLAQQHQSAVTELQQQLEQLEQALAQAQQAAGQHADDKARLAARVQAVECEKESLQGQLESLRAAKRASDDQVSILQQEQEQLLSRLTAVEESLLEARQLVEDQRATRARLEDSLQRKSIAAVEFKQELKEAKLQAQQATAEVHQLQQQLGALRNKAADTARQLSAARTAAKDAGEALAAEQARGQQQAALLDELRAELEKARRASGASQKAQAAEAKRATAAEAAVAALKHDLASAKDTAAEAKAACAAADSAKKKSQQQRQQAQQEAHCLEQQVEQLSQTNQRLVQQQHQYQHQVAEYEQSLAEYERLLTAAVQRAESADAELAGIRQEVAEWSYLCNRDSSELQETRQKLAAAETDLGVAIQRVAACGMQTRLGSSSRPASACATNRARTETHANTAPAARPGSIMGAALPGQQQQQLPVEVTRQLQWQAAEVVRLTGQVHHLQAQLHDAEQQLASCQQELAQTQQQLVAAEDAVSWHKHHQQQLHQQQSKSQLQQQQQSGETQQLQQSHQQLQQLQASLADADARVAELTSQLAAARSQLVQQQRSHLIEAQQLQEKLAAAEANAAHVQQQSRLLQEQHQAQQLHLLQKPNAQVQKESNGVRHVQQQRRVIELLQQAQASSSSGSDSEADSVCTGAVSGCMDNAATAALQSQQLPLQLQQQPGQRQQLGRSHLQQQSDVWSTAADTAAAAGVHSADKAYKAEAAAAGLRASIHNPANTSDDDDDDDDDANTDACRARHDLCNQPGAPTATSDGCESSSGSTSSSRYARTASGRQGNHSSSLSPCRLAAEQQHVGSLSVGGGRTAALSCGTFAGSNQSARQLSDHDPAWAVQPQTAQQHVYQQGRKQQLQQKLVDVHQQLLQQQQKETQSFSAPQRMAAVNAGKCCEVPSNNTALSTAAVSEAAGVVLAHNSEQWYPMVAARPLLGRVHKEQQPALTSTNISATLKQLAAEESSSQAWEIASSSCDCEGALAAAAIAMKAAAC